MKTTSTIIGLSGLIATLALIAAGMGVFWQDGGSSFEFMTVRGQAVLMQGTGLYKYDSVPMATMAIAQDIVTLFIGVPLLLLSARLYGWASWRGQLLLPGTLAYFLYTYMSYTFAAAYNNLFLLYTALFSLCLFTFILSLVTLDVQALVAHFSERLPHRFVAVFLIFISVELLMMHLGRIVPVIPANEAPMLLESYTTMVIAGMDLGILVPLSALTGVLLLRKRSVGYLLAAILLVKGFTMGLALTAMVIGALIAGTPATAFEIVLFPGFTLIGVGLFIGLLRNAPDRTYLRSVKPA